MSERGEVTFGDSLIRYEVVRSPRRRKTIEVTVDEPGLVTVAVPADTSPEEVEAMVRRRAGWIMRHDGAASASPPPRRFVSGESLPYLGRSVRLTVHPTDDSRVGVRFHHWQFDVDVPRSLRARSVWRGCAPAFEAWYRERAAMKLPPRSTASRVISVSIRRKSSSGTSDAAGRVALQTGPSASTGEPSWPRPPSSTTWSLTNWPISASADTPPSTGPSSPRQSPTTAYAANASGRSARSSAFELPTEHSTRIPPHSPTSGA